MQCNKCGNFVETAGEVRACATCSAPNDGTARQVPADLADTAAIETVITRVPGIGNRFVPGHVQAPAAVVKDPEAERALREKRAQNGADAESAHSRYPGPEEATTKTNEQLKSEKIAKDERDERERVGIVLQDDEERERKERERRDRERTERR